MVFIVIFRLLKFLFSAITSLLQPRVNSAAEGTLPLQVAHCQSSELEFSGQAGDAVELPPLSDCVPGVFFVAVSA